MKRQSIILSVIIVSVLLFGILLVYPHSYTNAKDADFVVVGCKRKTLQIGEDYFLPCFTYSGKQPSFKSSRSSVASVNSYGIITAKRAGTTRITAKISGCEAYCVITVKPTTITLSKTRVSLYRNQSCSLKAVTSTGHAPVFKSSKSSVATVDENGVITARKNGIANIKVSCDGTTSICEVTVKKPTITLSASTLTLRTGQSARITARVSSGNPVTWSVSNINILSVTPSGVVTARQKGKAYLYAKEDGTKVSCIIHVTDP
ncbi:MAG: Ig domain-containing protein [Lachnospiraceae bacterium]